MGDERDILLTTRKFRVERQTVRHRNGQCFEREVVVHPGAVVLLPLLDDSTVVMIRNTRHSVGRTLLELPAGTLEADEPPVECAARELQEETGYRAAELIPLISFFASPGVLSERMHAFVARGLTPVGQQLEETEEIDVEPTSLDRIRQMLLEGSLEDGKTIAVLGTYLLQQENRESVGRTPSRP